jgi:hypothetical protein
MFATGCCCCCFCCCTSYYAVFLSSVLPDVPAPTDIHSAGSRGRAPSPPLSVSSRVRPGGVFASPSPPLR